MIWLVWNRDEKDIQIFWTSQKPSLVRKCFIISWWLPVVLLNFHHREKNIPNCDCSLKQIFFSYFCCGSYFIALQQIDIVPSCLFLLEGASDINSSSATEQLNCPRAQKWMVMDTLWYKLTYPQGNIYIYNLIPCELFLSIRMVFCAGKKSYFCSQMDSSDKVPACLYTFCPAHSKWGRMASCHHTGSLPWRGCWEVR